MGGEGGDGMLSLTKSPKAWGCADLPEQACGLAGIKRRAPNCFWQFPAHLSLKKKNYGCSLETSGMNPKIKRQ